VFRVSTPCHKGDGGGKSNLQGDHSIGAPGIRERLEMEGPPSCKRSAYHTHVWQGCGDEEARTNDGDGRQRFIINLKRRQICTPSSNIQARADFNQPCLALSRFAIQLQTVLAYCRDAKAQHLRSSRAQVFGESSCQHTPEFRTKYRHSIGGSPPKPHPLWLLLFGNRPRQNSLLRIARGAYMHCESGARRHGAHTYSLSSSRRCR
jgi:hypothetical protein